jgi:hypothetical protein
MALPVRVSSVAVQQFVFGTSACSALTWRSEFHCTQERLALRSRTDHLHWLSWERWWHYYRWNPGLYVPAEVAWHVQPMLKTGPSLRCWRGQSSSTTQYLDYTFSLEPTLQGGVGYYFLQVNVCVYFEVTAGEETLREQNSVVIKQIIVRYKVIRAVNMKVTDC